MRWANIVLALAVFTVIVRYDRPGSVHGEVRWCVDAKSPRDAARHARLIAKDELKVGYEIRTVTVRDDRCWWLPGDEKGEWKF